MSWKAKCKVLAVTNSVNGAQASLAATDASMIDNSDDDTVNSVQLSISGEAFAHLNVNDEVVVSVGNPTSPDDGDDTPAPAKSTTRRKAKEQSA